MNKWILLLYKEQQLYRFGIENVHALNSSDCHREQATAEIRSDLIKSK